MKLKTILPLLFSAALSGIYGQAPSRPTTLFSRLTTKEGVSLTLTTDLSAVIANKNSRDYQPATLTDADGNSIPTQVKTRGKFRRRIAEIPPLKLKFKKKWLQAEGLDTLNEIKLVLPATFDKQGDELVVREYLAYKMFEYLTPFSTRARLINLTLVNTGLDNESQYTAKAILLEDEEELEARLGARVVESYGMPGDSFQVQQAALTVLFQYMIGNTDWNIEGRRNVRFLRDNAGQLLLIPFDFDFAGLVNAPYATPATESGLSNVRERFLMPQGIPESALKAALPTLQNAREGLYQICRSEFLSKAAAKNLEDYVDSFFQSLEKNRKGIFR